MGSDDPVSNMNPGRIFPSPARTAVFCAYIGLFVSYGILINVSRNNKGYKFNTVTVVLVSEILKLLIAALAYLYQKSWEQFKEEFLSNVKLLALYLIPSGLYCLYNNLAFINLTIFDPTTYFVFLQIRVVITGILYQLIFRRSLSICQWISLILLTSGCVIKEIGRQHIAGHTIANFRFDFTLLFLLIQVLCSCIAGVYNEFLLKDRGRSVHFLMQNVFMYVGSIVCNLVLLLVKGDLWIAFQPLELKAIFSRPIVVSIIVVISTAGIVTSLFLREFNSIVKNFASAIELILTAIAGWIILGIPIDEYTIVAMLLIAYSTLLYARNPVTVPERTSDKTKSDIV